MLLCQKTHSPVDDFATDDNDDFDDKHAISLAMAAAALLFPAPHLKWIKIPFASIEYFTVISMTGRLPSNYCP